MSARPSHDDYARRILGEIEAGGGVSQRALSRKMGIALGLTNLLLRRSINNGWIRIKRVRANRVVYLLTPTGIAQKARMTRAYFAASIRFYGETRQRVHDRFRELQAEWDAASPATRHRKIAFYGASDVAEIGYICLQETNFRLVKVFDDARTTPFFGIRVERSAALAQATRLKFDYLVVMSFEDGEGIRARLEAAGVPADRIYFI